MEQSKRVSDFAIASFAVVLSDHLPAKCTVHFRVVYHKISHESLDVPQENIEEVFYTMPWEIQWPTYARCTMGRLGVIHPNLQWLFFILIDCILYYFLW